MKHLERMKDQLICLVDEQLTHTETVDTKELGEAVDMIKDLAETIYYCTVTEAMHGRKHEDDNRYYVPMRDLDKRYGRMYYDPEKEMRDMREGRSPMARKMYMESKEMHHPHEKKMSELEKYMHELSKDITEMIEDATPEEKHLLHTKIMNLADKLV